MLPCKHMFTIFENIDVLDWNSFSVNYGNFPYFCLDIDSQTLDKCDEENPSCENEDLESVFKNDDQSFVYFNTLPKKYYAKRSKASMCRELLK